MYPRIKRNMIPMNIAIEYVTDLLDSWKIART